MRLARGWRRSRGWWLGVSSFRIRASDRARHALWRGGPVLAGLMLRLERSAPLFPASAEAAHAVAVAVDLQHGRVVQEPVEDRDRDGGVFEDRAPFGDPAVGGQDHRAVEVAAGGDLEQGGGGLGGPRGGG